MRKNKAVAFFSGFPDRRFTDESAIFIKNGKAEIIGVIHRIDKGEIRLFTEEDVRA